MRVFIDFCEWNEILGEIEFVATAAAEWHILPIQKAKWICRSDVTRIQLIGRMENEAQRSIYYATDRLIKMQ